MSQHPHAVTGRKAVQWFGLGLIVSGLAACGGGGGGGGSSTDTGTLRLAMTDAPSCGYQHVYVTVTKIRVHQSTTAGVDDAGWSELNIPPQRIDLLGLTNGVLQELGSLPLPAGTYQQVRLVLADNPANPTPANPLANAIVPAGSNNEIALTTPSGQQSGFKLQAKFDVTGNQLADMVLDFDACKSVVKAGNSGQYNLKPVVAVIKRLTTAIVGYVNPALAPGMVVSTRDPDNNLRATVPDATTGKFTLAYLPEGGNYTVVLSGQNLTTAAVTSVPVSLATGTTPVNPVTAPINPPASNTAGLAGIVTNTSAVALTDAQVSVRQALTSGQILDVAWTAVDPLSAGYNLTLPLAAPLKATYAGGNALSFTTDAVTPGAYNVTATAAGYTGQSSAPGITLGTPGSTTVKNLILVP